MAILQKLIGLVPLPVVKRISAARWTNPVVRRLFEWASRRLNNQEQVISRGAGKGLRFNPGGSNAGYALGTSEPYVQDALVALLRPGMTAYDIGANVGFLSLILARLVGPGGRVVCFEPLPGNVEMIERNARSNGFGQVTVRREAAGASDGNARFMVGPETVSSKLASVANPGDSFVGETEVSVRSLDSVRAVDGVPAPDFIKIDAEGAEADVLAGATETLNSARPLMLIELHGTDEAVAAVLSAHRYHQAMLKVEGPRAKYLLAAPAERTDLVDAIESLCRGALHA
jgi:FkbM family methyltransferase